MPQFMSRVLVHAVFSTKQRVPFLDASIRKQLHPYIGGILKNLECPPLQIGGFVDHAHLFFALSKNLSQAEVISKVKSNSSRWLSETFSECRAFSWQPGYGIKSVDPVNHGGLLVYIQNQEDHHKKVSFLEEYREFLESGGMHFDERDL
jgi:REP element-mobilizing transposase RayT